MRIVFLFFVVSMLAQLSEAQIAPSGKATKGSAEAARIIANAQRAEGTIGPRTIVFYPSQESSRPILSSFNVGDFGWLEKEDESGSTWIVMVIDEKTIIAQKSEKKFLLQGFDFHAAKADTQFRINIPLSVIGQRKYQGTHILYWSLIF